MQPASDTLNATHNWRDYFVRNHRLRAFWRLLLYGPIIVACSFLLQTIVGVLLSVAGIRFFGFISQVVIALGILLGTWVACRFVEHRSLASLGFALTRGWWRDIALGFGLGMLLQSLILGVELVLGWVQINGLGWDQFRNFPISIAASVVAMLAVGVTEETAMRGYVLQTIERGWGLVPAVIISSSILGLLHLINPTAEGWAAWVAPFSLSLAGLLFAMAYLARRSLWLPIALHMSWNLFEYNIWSLTGTRLDGANVLATNITGPALFVGLPNSSFGPEVGLLGILAMLLGIVLLWRFVNNRA